MDDSPSDGSGRDDLAISRRDYDEIGRLIESADSPVGIDAKKTHILILHKLTEIERRLDRLEGRLEARPPSGG